MTGKYNDPSRLTTLVTSQVKNALQTAARASAEMNSVNQKLYASFGISKQFATLAQGMGASLQLAALQVSHVSADVRSAMESSALAASRGTSISTSLAASIDVSKHFTKFTKSIQSSVVTSGALGPWLEYVTLVVGDEWRYSTERLAGAGWTIPMDFTLREMVELVEDPEQEIDSFFVDYYTENNFEKLRNLRRRLTSRKRLSQWQALLCECFESVENGRYVITIPALLTMIEGTVCRANGGVGRDIKRICKIRATELTGSITGLMWRSLEIFVTLLFQGAPFDKGRPSFINRHWILHGRDATSWEIADAIRLFNALQTIDALLKEKA